MIIIFLNSCIWVQGCLTIPLLFGIEIASTQSRLERHPVFCQVAFYKGPNDWQCNSATVMVAPDHINVDSHSKGSLLMHLTGPQFTGCPFQPWLLYAAALHRHRAIKDAFLLLLRTPRLNPTHRRPSLTSGVSSCLSLLPPSLLTDQDSLLWHTGFCIFLSSPALPGLWHPGRLPRSPSLAALRRKIQIPFPQQIFYLLEWSAFIFCSLHWVICFFFFFKFLLIFKFFFPQPTQGQKLLSTV